MKRVIGNGSSETIVNWEIGDKRDVDVGEVGMGHKIGGGERYIFHPLLPYALCQLYMQ